MQTNMTNLLLALSVFAVTLAVAQPPDNGGGPPGGNGPRQMCCIPGCTVCKNPPDCGDDEVGNLCDIYFSTCCAYEFKMQKSYNGSVEGVAYNMQGEKITIVDQPHELLGKVTKDEKKN